MRERGAADGVRNGLWIAFFGMFFRRKRKEETSLPAEPPPPLEPLRRGHEATDASAKGLAIFAICMAVVLLLIALAPIPIMYWLSRTHDRPVPRVDRLPLPPSPHLGPPGDAEIIAMRERDRQSLESYGWADRNAGIAHVPVESVIPRVAAELNAANSTAVRRPPTADSTARSGLFRASSPGKAGKPVPHERGSAVGGRRTAVGAGGHA